MFAKGLALNAGVERAPDEMLLALDDGVVSCRGIEPEVGILNIGIHHQHSVLSMEGSVALLTLTQMLQLQSMTSSSSFEGSNVSKGLDFRATFTAPQ